MCYRYAVACRFCRAARLVQQRGHLVNSEPASIVAPVFLPCDVTICSLHYSPSSVCIRSVGRPCYFVICCFACVLWCVAVPLSTLSAVWNMPRCHTCVLYRSMWCRVVLHDADVHAFSTEHVVWIQSVYTQHVLCSVEHGLPMWQLCQLLFFAVCCACRVPQGACFPCLLACYNKKHSLSVHLNSFLLSGQDSQ